MKNLILILACLSCALLAPSASAAISAPARCAVVAFTSLTTAAFGTVASGCATPAANVTGNHITVYISYQGPTAVDITTGCTDTIGNTYTLVPSGVVYDNIVTDICYADNITGGSGNQVTAVLSSSTGIGAKFVYAEESSGVATSVSLDTFAVNASFGTSITKMITTASAGEQVVSFLASNVSLGTISPGSGFTAGYPGIGTSDFYTSYQIAGTAGAYTSAPFWVNGAHVIEFVAAFRAASGVTITLSPSSLTSGMVGTAYAQTIVASGGTGPYTYALSGGSLPAGLALNSSTGAIAGTPTAAGTSSFTVTGTDSGSNTGAMAYSIPVSAPAASFAVTTDGVTTLWMPNAWGDGTASLTTGGLSGAIANLPNCGKLNIVALTHGVTYLAPNNTVGLTVPNQANASCATLITTDSPWMVPATGVRGVGSNPPIILAAQYLGVPFGIQPEVLGFAPGAHDVRVYGVKVGIAAGGSDLGYFYLTNMGFTGGGTQSRTTAQLTHHITFDHMAIGGTYDKPGPCRDVGFDGMNNLIVDSILDEAKGTILNPQDCQAIVSTSCINCTVRNTQLAASTENYMTGGSGSTVPGFITNNAEFAGIYSTKHIQWRRFFAAQDPSVGDGRPACVYYLPDEGYAGQVGGELWQNNGTGNYSTDTSTGNTWQCNSGGTWTSLGSMTLSTAYGNALTTGGQNGGEKNDFEVKYGHEIRLWGSVLSNMWASLQDELLILNGPDGADINSSRGTRNVTIEYNIMRDAHGCLTAGSGFTSGPHPEPFTGVIERNNVLDNCSQAIRGWNGSPHGTGGGGLFGEYPDMNTIGGSTVRMTQPGGWLVGHNTNVNSFGSDRGNASGTPPAILETSMGDFSAVDSSTFTLPVYGLGIQWLNNVLTMTKGGMQADCGATASQITQYGGFPNCNSGTVRYYAPNSDMSYNVFSADGTTSGSFGSSFPGYNAGGSGLGGAQHNFIPASVSTVLTNPVPATWSGTNWVYGDYSVTSNATGCNPTTGATAAPSGNCHGAASDGGDPGADWYSVAGFTAHAVDGLYNPNLQFLVSLPVIRVSSTSAKISFQAPLATSSCSVLVSATESFASPIGSHSYTQAGQEVFDTVTGLSGKVLFFKVTCPDGTNGGTTNLVRGPYTFWL